jgi:predicted regulator of Ras-like GTPase activity (Roadblock/LC7/MglB family)
MAHTAELEDRISKCNKILSENPNSQIFAALAEAYRKKGDIDKAFRVCQSGLKIHPDYGSAHLVMAKINFDKGLYDWAEMEVTKAAEIDGSNHATDLLLSEIYIYKGEFAKATKILNRLHSVDSGNQQVIKLMELAKKLPLQSPEKKRGKQPPITAEPITEEPTITEYAPVDVSLETPEEKTLPDTGSSKGSISLEQLINSISAITNVEGVLLINREGLVAEQIWNLSQSPDEYGAFAREIEKSIQQQVDLTGFGEYENILIETENSVVSFLPVDENLLLIKANEKINLGTLKLKLNAQMKRLDLNL